MNGTNQSLFNYSEANAGKSFQMQILFNIFPRISLHCKLVPVQYWEYEYGLFKRVIRLRMGNKIPSIMKPKKRSI